jgi:arylsulfatase A-like enzyme
MIAPDFDLETVDLVFLDKSKAFIRDTVQNDPQQPFFLFHSMQAVHLPSFPADAFKGKTEAGPHGDFIHESDWIVGELLQAIEEAGVADNTLVIFTSDNGPETTAVHHMRTDHKHDGARPWRGMKRDNWEAGHRVPFIVTWPNEIKAGRVSDKLICQTDILATVAEIVGRTLADDAGEDSFSALNELINANNDSPIRPHIVHQGFAGDKKLAIRKGKWKYLNHKGSGGNNYEKNRVLKRYALEESDPNAPAQLYDLHNDPGETKNLYAEYPEVVSRMSQLLKEVKQSGRSRD